jgi:hypothetical protein
MLVLLGLAVQQLSYLLLRQNALRAALAATSAATCCRAGPDLPPDTPFVMDDPSGTYVRTDNATSLAYPDTGNGTTAPEQFLAYHASDPGSTALISEGQTALLQSKQTGMWCRIVPNPSNTTQLGMQCDQPTSSTAMPFTWLGDGLAVDGVKLVSTGLGQPLLLANTTTSPITGPGADQLMPVVVPDPEGAQPRLPHNHDRPTRDCSGCNVVINEYCFPE